MVYTYEFEDGVYAFHGGDMFPGAKDVLPTRSVIGYVIDPTYSAYLAAVVQSGIRPEWTHVEKLGDLNEDDDETEDDGLDEVVLSPQANPSSLPKCLDVEEPPTDRWYSLKQAVLRCFGCSETADDWDRDQQWRRAAITEMRHHVVVPVGSTVESVVTEQVEQVCGDEVKHVPRLVVQVVVALRMKLGVGAMDRSVPGNVALVRAETAKMLREWNLRKKDAAAHLVMIEQCFFEDDTHYRISTWRARMAKRSRFVRWIVGESEPVRFDC